MPGMARAHGAQQRQRQAGGGRAGREPDRHRAREPLAGGVHVDPRLLALAQDELGVAVEHLAGFGRRHAAFGPQQQLLPDLALQRRQLLAERGLGHVQDVGGLGQAADIDDLHEILQAPQIHGLPHQPASAAASKNLRRYPNCRASIRDSLSRQTELVLAYRSAPPLASRPDAASMAGFIVNSSRIAERVRRIKPSPSTAAADRANELRREGSQIVSLVVGEPDFDTPAHIRQAAADAMEKGATRYTLMAGYRGSPAGDRGQARARERAGLCARRDHRDQRRQERDLQRVRGDAGARRRSDHPGAVLGLLSRHGAGLRWRAGHRACREAQGFKLTRGAAGGGDHASDALAADQFAEQPDRRELHSATNIARSPTCWRSIPHVHGHDRRHLRAHPLRRRHHAASSGGRARTARPHAGDQRRFEDLRHDRLADRLDRRVRAISSQAHQHPAVPIGRKLLFDQPGGGRRRARRRPELRRGERRDLSSNGATRRWPRINAIPGLSCRAPDGAFYLYVNCGGLIGKTTPDGKRLDTDGDVVMYFLESAGVAVVAGTAYGLSPYFRLSIATSLETLDDGVERIARAVAALNSRRNRT